MAQWLRVLVVLAEDANSVPNTYIRGFTVLSSGPGDPMFASGPLEVLHAHSVHIISHTDIYT